MTSIFITIRVEHSGPSVSVNCKSQENLPTVVEHKLKLTFLVECSTYQPSSLDHLCLLDDDEDLGCRGMRCNFKTRAYPSLRDSTCPNPKCSSHSSSIPCLLLLSAAPGVLAIRHISSVRRRGEPWRRGPREEDGSCRAQMAAALRAFSRPQTTQT